jgi:hypothetical protein
MGKTIRRAKKNRSSKRLYTRSKSLAQEFLEEYRAKNNRSDYIELHG